MQIFCDTFFLRYNKGKNHQNSKLLKIITFFDNPAQNIMLKKFTSREKKLLSYTGLFFALLVFLWIVFVPDSGILDMFRSRQKLEKLQAENIKLEQENKVLQEEIDKLQNDPAYIEEKARKEYGMLKENEVLYIFKKKE